jgi:hypothetical protein
MNHQIVNSGHMIGKKERQALESCHSIKSLNLAKVRLTPALPVKFLTYLFSPEVLRNKSGAGHSSANKHLRNKSSSISLIYD